MRDVLQQMVVKTESGESVMLFDLSGQAEEKGTREELEARRLDTLMRLGVKERTEGPIHVSGISVRAVSNEQS